MLLITAYSIVGLNILCGVCMLRLLFTERRGHEQY